jgi:hypothetical protein
MTINTVKAIEIYLKSFKKYEAPKTTNIPTT